MVYGFQFSQPLITCERHVRDLLDLVALQVEAGEGSQVTEGGLSGAVDLVPAQVQHLDPGRDHGVYHGDAELPRQLVVAEVQGGQVGQVMRAVLTQGGHREVVTRENQRPEELVFVLRFKI